MDIQFLSAAAVGVALLAASPAIDSPKPDAGDAEGLVGAKLYASETHIDRWGDPVRAEDVALEGLGTVKGVIEGVQDGSGVLLVSVGGLWGWGAQEVEVGMDRLHLLRTASGDDRLVVDLSAEGAEPISG
jgi:hypothetical protein